MSKYDPLSNYLRRRKGDVWQAEFSEIEAILGFPLPESARRYPAWWANQNGGGHSQTAGWQSAGWRTADLDLAGKSVRFERLTDAQSDDIWAEVRRATGLTDQRALESAAAAALLQKEAAKRLALLGGTMPDAAAAPRERPAL